VAAFSIIQSKQVSIMQSKQVSIMQSKASFYHHAEQASSAIARLQAQCYFRRTSLIVFRENGDFNKKSKFLNVHQRKNLR
jgi:hypothetical protein